MFLKNLLTNKEQPDRLFFSATPIITYRIHDINSDLIFITDIHIDADTWLRNHANFSYDIIKKGLFFKGIQFSNRCDYIAFKMRWL